MSARVFAMRSALRIASRQVNPRQLTSPAARRSYASHHDAAAKSSDMPWLLASVAATVTGGAYLFATGPKKAETHGGHEHQAKHDEPSDDESKEDAPDDSSEEDGDKGGEPESSHKSAQAGKDVPPPPADNSSGSEKKEEKKKARDDYQETIEKKDTKAAASSSDTPSKKTESEHPREDPKKGEGEGTKKGGSKDE